MSYGHYKRFFFISLLIFVLLAMLFRVPLVIQGAHTGLELWYESVLPSILPFMIITSLLLQQVHGNYICFLGLFCGLPVGANLVNQYALTHPSSTATANALLCICNITSPMFILGYILNQTFYGQVSTLKFLAVIYIPIVVYGIISFLYFRSSKLRTNAKSLESTESISSFEHILKHSLQVILMVGIYIMLFCIIIQFLLHLLPTQFLLPKILKAFLEITNGIHLLMTLPISFQQKTALIAGLTSFGGICSILQTKSVLTNSGLSILHYIVVKLCMGIFSYLLALIWL